MGKIKKTLSIGTALIICISSIIFSTVIYGRYQSIKAVLSIYISYVGTESDRFAELTANNRQLQSNFSQLKDVNRFLITNNQQLKSNNRQLSDNLGLLSANIKQLESNNRQLTENNERVSRLNKSMEERLRSIAEAAAKGYKLITGKLQIEDSTGGSINGIPNSNNN